jgi:hypothetical protein
VSTPASTSDQEPLLVLTPKGAHSDVVQLLLAHSEFNAVLCGGVEDLCRRMTDTVATAAVLPYEALTEQAVLRLETALARARAVSDFPLVVLASNHRGAGNAKGSELLDRVGNVILLEQPVSSGTVVSLMHFVLRVRRQQADILS